MTAAPAPRPERRDRPRPPVGPAGRPRPDRYAVGPGGVVITATAIEQRIVAVSDEMEDLTYRLADLAQQAAEAEATYKAAFAKARIIARDQDGHGPGGRTTNDEADDRAINKCEDMLRMYLIAGALYASTRDALFAKRSQMEALRTLAANVRAQV